MIERDDLLKILVFITVTKKIDSMIFEKKTPEECYYYESVTNVLLSTSAISC